MIRERKSMLKIRRVAVEAMLMKRKDVIKHSAIASKKNPVTKWLFFRFSGCSPSFSGCGTV
jgi:hypothetical protein